jgi:hypothetical protein
MDLTTEFARQGLVYLIAVIEAGVIVWLFVRIDNKDKVVENRDAIIRDLQEKRVVEARDYADKFITVGKDMTNGMVAIKEAQSSFNHFIEKFQSFKT